MVKLFSFSSILKNYWYIFILVLVGIVLITIFISYRKNKKKFTKIAKEYEKSVNNFLDNDIEYKLARIERIGASNVAYLELYNGYLEEYNILSKNVKDSLLASIDLVNSYLEDEKYFKMTKEIKSCKNRLNNLTKAYNEFSNRLSAQLKDEDEVREKEKSLKNRIDILVDKINGFGPNLDFIKKDQLEIINKFDNRFEIFNEYALRGNYVDARETLGSIENDVDNIESYIDKLYEYGQAVSIEIPQTLNHIIDKYNEMNQKKFPLHHIQTVKIVNICKNKLIDIFRQLKNKEYNDISNEIEYINAETTKLNNLLNNEIKAKEEFNAYRTKIYNEADLIERNHAKRVKAQENLDKDFSLSPERAKINNLVKAEIQKLSIARRALDTVVYSNSPYSICLNKLKELENQVEVVKKVLEDNEKHTQEIKNSGKEAINTSKVCSFKLRNLEIDLRNSKYDKIISNHIDQFNAGYKLINTLNNLLNTKPIDMKSVIETSDSLKILVKELENTVNKDLSDAEYCEKLLMFANKYRPIYAYINSDLTKAEVFYYDGRYENCIEVALSALKNFTLPNELIR